MSKKLWRVDEQDLNYVAQAIEGGLTGKYTKIFESKFAESFGVEYAVALNSGTSALHVALAAMGIKEGDEVITTPLTFAASTFCILYMGATPVFADVDPITWNIDPQSIEKKITSKTKAIVIVALYGLPADFKAIGAIAKKHNLKILEDNAQCVLGKCGDQVAGTFGDAAIFSLQRSKHLTTGDGGVIITNDEGIAERSRKIADLGYAKLTAKPIVNENFKDQIQDPDYKRHVMLGYNFRMPEVVAAMGIAQLEKMKMLVEKRIAIAELYAQAVKGCSWLTPQGSPEGFTHSWWTYVLKLDTKKISWKDFRQRFLANGGDRFYAAWALTYREPALAYMNIPQGTCPVAESLQPVLIQLKTNFQDLVKARQQADILEKTIREIN